MRSSITQDPVSFMLRSTNLLPGPSPPSTRLEAFSLAGEWPLGLDTDAMGSGELEALPNRRIS